MKKILFLGLLAVMMLPACTSEEKKAQKKITDMEESLFNSEAGLLSQQQAEDIIGAYMDYAEAYPQNPLSAEYLFRASDVSMNTGNFALSLNLLSRIQADYPDYNKVSQCLFLQGFIWENYIGNAEKAREVYERFLEEYPDNDFADDVALSLKNLGKTPEELIKMFEQENGRGDK